MLYSLLRVAPPDMCAKGTVGYKVTWRVTGIDVLDPKYKNGPV